MEAQYSAISQDPYDYKRAVPTPQIDYDFEREMVPESEITLIRPIPFHAVASDFDGVVSLYGKETKEEADRIRELFIEKTLAIGVPLAFITGKDEKNVVPDIIEPFRAKIQELGIELEAGQFRVYANNGAVTIDVGLDNQVLNKQTFNYETLEAIGDLEIVQIMMDIYDIFHDIRSRIPEAYKETRFRGEETTLGFSMKPEHLDSPHVRHLQTRLLELAGKEKDLTRFDIGQIFQKQLKVAGLEDIVIAVTDGAVDLTPPGTGKRNALERFAQKHAIEVQNTLRIGDNPTGSDFPLLAPKEGERRGGYSNVAVEEDKVIILQEQNQGFGTPHEIDADGNQFQRTIALLEEIHTTTPWVSTQL